MRNEIESNSDVSNDKWQWPGEYLDKPKWYGGDCKIEYRIKRKNKLFYVTGRDTKAVGHPSMALQFYAWLNRFTGVDREVNIEIKGFSKENIYEQIKSIDIKENASTGSAKY